MGIITLVVNFNVLKELCLGDTVSLTYSLPYKKSMDFESGNQITGCIDILNYKFEILSFLPYNKKTNIYFFVDTNRNLENSLNYFTSVYLNTNVNRESRMVLTEFHR